MANEPQRIEELQEKIAKLEEEKRLNIQVQQYAAAMGIIYPLAISLDYLKNEYHMLEYERFLNKTAKWSGTVDELIEVGASTIPDKEYAEKFRNLFGREKAVAAFRAGKTELTLKHPQWGDDGKVHWMETKVICLECSETRAESISVSKCIDEEKKIENANKLLEEQIAVFRTLSRNFKNLYLVNIENETARVLKYDGEYPYGDIESFGGQAFPYVDLLNTWIDNQIYQDDQEMLRRELSPARLREIFASKEEYVGNYRMFVDGKIINYQFNLSKADIDGYIIAGFQNIESIIQEHLEQEKKQREIEEKYQNQLKEQLMVFDTLARNFKNVYLADLERETARILKLDAAYVDVPGKKDHHEFPFDAVVSHWVDTIVYPEDRDKVRSVITVENVKKIFKTKDEFVGNYRSLVDGEIHYFQYSLNKVGEDGTKAILGFQNIDDIIEEHLETDKAEREKEAAHQKEVDEQLAIINALSQSFRNVFVANLSDGTARVIRLADSYNVRAIRDVNGQTFPFDAVVDRWVRETVHPEDKKRVKETLNIENIRKLFSQQDKCVGTYRNVEDGVQHYYQYDFRRVGDTDSVVAGFQIIDDIVEEQTAHQKELEDQFAIINTLSSNYMNIYLANLNDGSARAIRISEDYGYKEVQTLKDVSFSFDEIIKIWADRYIYPNEDKAKMARMLSLKNLQKVFSKQDSYIGNYQSTEQGGVHHYQFDIRKVDDAGNVVAGFQNIDAIIEEHEAQEKEKRELEEARLKGEKEHAEVVNSLSTIYSTIFRADIITHEYEILNSVPLMGTVAASKGNFDDVKDTIIESFMEPEFREPLREFLDLDTLADRLEKVNSVIADYKAPTGQWMQGRFIAKRRDENGRAIEALYVAHDITEEKTRDLKQQEALTHALAAAQQANKAKTTFLNSMSHDIRTPMNAIIGFTALAQTHLENHALVEDYLSKISTSSNHLLSLINDILDMSRIESGTVKLEEKAVHIPDLLHDLRTMIQSLVNSKNLNLFIDTQDVVHEDVLADKLRLNQVLLNIVGNAIKFTQPGGDIIIRLIEKPCSLKHYTTYEFSVKDNGIGMSKEFVGHIFDTFSREYSSTVSGIQGTGLGMAITKNIVDMMGGDIQVESEEGKGSLFTVTLNLRLANEPVKNEPIPELLGARALVVDDDMNTCRSVSKMLRDIQMHPDWTTSAKEAIVHAQDASDAKDEYKVYIIDYLMPDMNGIEIVRRIRKVISDDVPIIVLTAYDWADFEHEAREAGVTASVSKPIFMSELREVLTQPVVSEKIAKEEKQKGYDYSDKHVLLVEDNELNREIATAILEETGMTIDSVEDGDIAVATINREPADKYDLILMDVQMPRMDGYTATREIRTLADNKKANIPIVAMTANAFEEDKKKAYESGMNGHIIKPISIEEIAKVLNEIFAERE
jgi:signal transduction histidine kinase/DNA-binding response OmpR family regulator